MLMLLVNLYDTLLKNIYSHASDVNKAWRERFRVHYTHSLIILPPEQIHRIKSEFVIC